VTGSETVKFSRWSGKAKVAGGAVQALSFEVDVTSLDTGKERLNQHLQSPDFFDTANHPKATFVSTKIEPGAAEAGMTHTVTGDLAMRGITNSVTFPMALEVTGDEAKGSAEFAINRLDWKVAFPGAPDNLIQDKVVLTVKMVAANPNASTAAR
jgi:polyisoprenoid-binding protein YceI